MEAIQMGDIFRISCKDCQFEKTLKSGAGLMSIRAEVVNQNLQGEDLEKWQELQRGKNVRFFSWRYEIAVCDTCKDIASCFVVDVHTNEGGKICLGGKCENCQCKLDVISKKELICPKCGQNVMSKQLTGRWD